MLPGGGPLLNPVHCEGRWIANRAGRAGCMA